MFKKNKKRFSSEKRPVLSSQKNKGAGKKKIIRRLLLLGLGLFLIYAYTAGDYGFIRIYSLLQEKKNLQLETKKLEAKIVDLNVEKKRLQGDLLYIEKIAREKYGMAKEDEKVYKFSEEKPKTDSLK